MFLAMRRQARRVVNAAAARLGYRSNSKLVPIPVDCDRETATIIERVQPYTLTPPARVMALCEAVRYITNRKIPGAIVECGVWRGGSMIAAASTLQIVGDTGRDLYLFDTFTEFPEPLEGDEQAWGSTTREELFENITTSSVFQHLPVDQVRSLVESTGYPTDQIQMVQGLVEDTIPDQAPDQIAICRLDTDWYRSTAHELAHLYQRISPGGVLIIDDYGEFRGARRAVDEFLAGLLFQPMLHRVDESCRILVVP